MELSSNDIQDVINSFLEATTTGTSSASETASISTQSATVSNELAGSEQQTTYATYISTAQIDPNNDLQSTTTVDDEAEIDNEINNDTNELTDEVTDNADINLSPLPDNINESVSRFQGAPWFDEVKKKVIILAGLGGIGSHCAYMLSRLKPREMMVYDDDLVDSSNMSGQMYNDEAISLLKTAAVSRLVGQFSGYYNISTYARRYTEQDATSDIMICGFDDMNSRRVFFENWLKHVEKRGNSSNECLFIDGRLSAECLQVLCIRGDDKHSIENYKNNYLFSNEQADSEVCSYKQTTYMASMIASIMVNVFVNHCTNLVCGPVRPVPFFSEYDAETMFLKVQL